MQTNTEITVLDRLAVVNLDVHIWSASRKLKPIDLGNANLPPEELASLGSKRVCNPEELVIFKTLKARATALLERTGIRFLGGWAVPEEKLEEIDTGLAVIRDDFNGAKDAFLTRYEESVQDWIDKHTGWEKIIATSIVSEDYVRSRIGFRWQMYRVALPMANTELQDNLESDVCNLGATLYEEIAKSAAETWKNCYEGKVEVTRKALSPLKTMRDKLMGLSFIEPRVTSIASLISTALDSIPPRGPITGPTLLMLQGLVALLRTPQDIVEHGQKILEGQTAEKVLASITSQPYDTCCLGDTFSNENDMADISAITPVPILESCGLW